MAERKFFLGVDGGQSGTTAMIGDETGQVLGEGHAGPCNHASGSEGVARFRQAIGGAVRAASEAAELADIHFAGACLGLSGGTAGRELLARELVKAGKYRIEHDALVALTGATGGEPGIVAIAGTGSIAFGRNAAGKIARAGGWGYIFGDEGGAFDLVRQAMRAALRQEEGWGPATTLRAALLKATGAPDMNTLLHWCYTPEFPKERIASFAKLVDEAARGGDAIAREILHTAAHALATLVAAVRGQLFHRGESPRISYIGGVFRSEILRERFANVVELEGQTRIHAPAFGPAEGALIEAYRLLDLRVQPRHAPPGT